MIDAVVFDWGGTLSIYADIDMEDMWRMAAKHLAAGTDPDREDEIRVRLVEVEAHEWARLAHDQRSFTLAQLLADASEALHLDVAGAVIEEASKSHLDAWTPHIRHDPDAQPVLAELKRRGLKVGLLSNTHWPREFHEHFLARDGLAGYIDGRVYTSELTHCKPHASAFRAALDLIGASDPHNAVFVGDRGYDDIFGAQQLGMRAVHRPNAMIVEEPPGADATIQSLPELLSVLDRWS